MRRGSYCIECLTKLKEPKIGDTHFWACGNDKCSRYGLLTIFVRDQEGEIVYA